MQHSLHSVQKKPVAVSLLRLLRQESRAIARKPRDAAAVLFGLKFADNIHYKFKSIAKLRMFESQASELQASELQTYRRKTEFNAKWPFKVIQGHVFWSQWKGDKGLSNTKY